MLTKIFGPKWEKFTGICRNNDVNINYQRHHVLHDDRIDKGNSGGMHARDQKCTQSLIGKNKEKGHFKT